MNLQELNKRNIAAAKEAAKERDRQDAERARRAKPCEVASAAEIDINHGSNQAFATGGFAVTLPTREQFASAAAYYSTMFHELTHTTATVQGRDLSGYHKSRKERAREELVAEIGAAYIMSYLGIETDFTEANSAAYMKSWAANLKDDSSAILYAAPKAIDAAEQIINSLDQAGDKTPTDPEGTSEGTAEETEAAEQFEAETPDFENVDFTKGEYHIRTQRGVEIVKGYTFNIAGIAFGVTKSNSNWWSVTHIGTGLLVNMASSKTRKDAVKDIEYNFPAIVKALEQGKMKEKIKEFEELKRAAA